MPNHVHQLDINEAGAADNLVTWEDVAAEARQLLDRIETRRNDGTELSVDSMRELLLPFIIMTGDLPRTSTEGADYLTNIQSFFEFFGTVIQNTLCISLILDTFTSDRSEDSSEMTYDWLNISIGMGVGILLALGEILCHRIINIVNQDRNAALLQMATEDASLTLTQKAALAIEAVSHVGEVAAQYVILTRFIPNPTTWMRPLIYAGAGLVGIAGSVAETRTHLNSIRRYNSIFNRARPAEPVEADNFGYQALNGNPGMPNGHRPR